MSRTIAPSVGVDDEGDYPCAELDICNDRFKSTPAGCFRATSSRSRLWRPRPQAVPLGRELPLPGHPRLANHNVSDRIRTHLVGIAFQNREIRFLALFERAEAVALSKLSRGVDRYGANRA
jgi:hypothetical protein